MPEKDCYKMSAELINKLDETGLTLCNGWVYSTLLERMIQHAWIENNDWVWDYSNNRRLIIKRKDYYIEGRINGVIHYTKEGLCRRFGRFGRFLGGCRIRVVSYTIHIYTYHTLIVYGVGD